MMVEDYSWVEPEYLAHKFSFIQGEVATSGPLEIGASSDWGIFSISDEKRIYQHFEGCYIPFYSCIFQKLEFDFCYPLLRMRFWIIFVFPLYNFIYMLRILYDYSNTCMSIRGSGFSFSRSLYPPLRSMSRLKGCRPPWARFFPSRQEPDLQGLHR